MGGNASRKRDRKSGCQRPGLRKCEDRGVHRRKHIEAVVPIHIHEHRVVRKHPFTGPPGGRGHRSYVDTPRYAARRKQQHLPRSSERKHRHTAGALPAYRRTSDSGSGIHRIIPGRPVDFDAPGFKDYRRRAPCRTVPCGKRHRSPGLARNDPDSGRRRLHMHTPRFPIKKHMPCITAFRRYMYDRRNRTPGPCLGRKFPNGLGRVERLPEVPYDDGAALVTAIHPAFERSHAVARSYGRGRCRRNASCQHRTPPCCNGHAILPVYQQVVLRLRYFGPGGKRHERTTQCPQFRRIDRDCPAHGFSPVYERHVCTGRGKRIQHHETGPGGVRLAARISIRPEPVPVQTIWRRKRISLIEEIIGGAQIPPVPE